MFYPKHHRWLAPLLLILGWELMAQGMILPPRHPPLPNPLPRPHLPLSVRALHIETTIRDTLAHTRVEQVFYNPGFRLEEGTWIFPLPKGAKVTSFTMFINGVETKPELLDSAKAKSIYEEIVRNARDPALMEFLDHDLFRVRIFPIEARSEKKIRLAWQHVVPRDDGLHRYSYPLRATRFASREIADFSLKVDISTSRNLKTLYAPSHQFEEHRKDAGNRILVLKSRSFTPKRNVKIFYASDEDSLGMKALAHTGDDGNYFWLSITPDFQTTIVIPKDLVLVIDTSGSMAGKKMEQARKALHFCIDNLNSKDRFEIIRFSTESESLAGTLLKSGDNQKQKARDFINGLEAIGGTNVEDALRAAMALPVETGRPQAIIMVTDGKPTIGERNEKQLLKLLENKRGKRLFSLGIGDEINTHLLDKLAGHWGGSRTYVGSDEDLELELSSLYNKIRSPVLSDLELEATGVRLSRMHPHKLPDLFRGLPLNLFGLYRGSGNAEITLKGKIDGNTQTFIYKFRFPKSKRDNPFIPQLWATRRVGFLLDEIRLRGKNEELVGEITRLAKKYGIVTPYTSYLILEDDMEIDRGSDSTLRVRPSRNDYHFPRALEEKSGRASVTTSQDLYSMAESDALPAVMSPRKEKGVQPVEYAGGRAFYLRDGIWTDSLLSGNDKAGAIEAIEFAGDAWFQFIARNPETAIILALGERVRFLLGNRIIEVVKP